MLQFYANYVITMSNAVCSYQTHPGCTFRLQVMLGSADFNAVVLKGQAQSACTELLKGVFFRIMYGVLTLLRSLRDP